MSEIKEKTSSAEDVKEEKVEDSKLKEESHQVDEIISKNSQNDVDSVDKKEESEKEKSDDDEEDDEEEEEEMGLLDRPVEVTGCRARKKVERLEYAVTPSHKEKTEIPEGTGIKLGDCPRIELQIQKTDRNELKPLHKILFNKVGVMTEIKKNIRKFCGFSFKEGSKDFDRRKAVVEKLTSLVLKRICDILDIERGGTKDEIVKRIMTFLCDPKDSGKAIPQKKTVGKDKKKSGEKKSKDDKKVKPKTKKEASSEDEADSSSPVAASDSDEVSAEEDESDNKTKKKQNASKTKKVKTLSKKQAKKEKSIKEEKDSAKGAKRKRSSDDKEEETPEQPPTKKTKMPSDEEIKKLVKRILDAADLQEITMKKVIKQVADAYPDFDMSNKKSFIKSTIKSVIS